MFDTVSALFNMIKGSLNSLINGESQILGRQGKNKDLSSGTGARTRALDRGTAFPGRGGWEDHSRGRWGGGWRMPRRTLRRGGQRGPLPPPPLAAQGLQRDRRGRGGEARRGSREREWGSWHAPASVSWQKWPSRRQAAERSPSWLNCGFLSRLAAAWGGA